MPNLAHQLSSVQLHTPSKQSPMTSIHKSSRLGETGHGETWRTLPPNKSVALQPCRCGQDIDRDGMRWWPDWKELDAKSRPRELGLSSRRLCD